MSWNRCASSVAAGLSRSLTVIATADWRSGRGPGSGWPAARDGLGEGGREVGADAHHLAGRAHLRPQQRVGAGEPRRTAARPPSPTPSVGSSRAGRGRRCARRAPRGTAASTSGMPVALATNGTVREARGLASITYTSPSRTANCTLTRPTTPSARASSRVWRRTSASTSSPMASGGITQAESPECMPASSTCSMTAPISTSSPSETASTSISIASSTKRSTSGSRRSCPSAASPRRSRCASRGHRARSSAAPAPGSRSSRPPRPPRRRRRRSPRPAPPGRGRVEQRAEALAVLGQVDRRERRAEDRDAGLDQPPREPQRRLAAELHHDARRLLGLDDLEHVLDRERLEVQAVGGVVVGGDRLRVAVHHDRRVAQRAQRHARRARSSSRTPGPARCGSGPEPRISTLGRSSSTGSVLVLVRRVAVARCGPRPRRRRSRRSCRPARTPAARRASRTSPSSRARGAGQPRVAQARGASAAATARGVELVEARAAASSAQRVGHAGRARRRNQRCTPDSAASAAGVSPRAQPRQDACRSGPTAARRAGRSRRGSVSSSRLRSALPNASQKVRPIDIASPTLFMCVVSRSSAPGNFSKAKRGSLHHDVVQRRLEARPAWCP